MKADEVNWKDIFKRIDYDLSKKYGRVMLKPRKDCEDCHGSGISSHTYDCGALNCRGHNDIICSCREFPHIDCPYGEDHPNVHGNWSVVYGSPGIYVRCYNISAHMHSDKNIILGYAMFRIK